MPTETKHLRTGSRIIGLGTVIREHPRLKPESVMCRGCYNDDYNHGLGGQTQCWHFEGARVVDKSGHSSIHTVGGHDVRKNKTLNCWVGRNGS